MTTTAATAHISHISTSLSNVSSYAPSPPHERETPTSSSDPNIYPQRQDSTSSESSTGSPGVRSPLPPRVKVIEKPQMSEINPGVWDGLTTEQVRRFFPDEWERFVRDPYAYRASRAESYHDLCGKFQFPLLCVVRTSHLLPCDQTG